MPKLTLPRQIVLASGSPRRKELLEAIGMDFIVHPGKFNERETHITPEELALHNAMGKAQDVSRHYKDALIIGVDTVVAFREHFLGKPKNREDHKRILRILSNTTHKVISAICIIDTKSNKNITAVETTLITIDRLDEADIEAYVNSGEGEDKAGGYAIQGIGALFCKKIEGDYFNVVGLPMYRLRKLLKEFGINRVLALAPVLRLPTGGYTPLQKSFPPHYLNRSLLKVKRMFRNTEVKFMLEFSRAVRRSKIEEITVLDLGCGTGTTIEDFWQKMSNPAWRYGRRLHGKKLLTIGIDQNPLPSLIPEKILRITKVPRTKFLKADAQKLPLPDNFVDFAYSVGLLRYLKDPLRALEEGFRVLKPGGTFLWLLSDFSDVSTKPTLEKILAETPGAKDIFTVSFGKNPTRGTLICTKHASGSYSKFSKFSFKLSHSFPRALKTKPTDEFLEHRVYEKLPL